MGDVQVRDEMIEIGDPNEEPSGPDPSASHRVVIEYRERGVPWMLIPPLLMLSAVLAVLGARFLEPERHRPAATIAKARPEPAAPPALAAVNPPPALDPTPVPAPAVELVQTEPDPVLPAPGVVIEAVPDLPPPAVAAEPAPEVAVQPEGRPFPRAEGIGFDPKALEAVANAPAPADPAVEPVANQGPGGEADQVAPNPVADADKPAEVDPDLLPPDPRLARVRKAERVAEARRQADAERAEFHAQLRKICARSGIKSGPAIKELIERYATKPDEAQIKQAVKYLNGRAAGAGKAARIALLRSLGFGESYVLGDLIENDSRWQDKGARNGPRTQGELAYYAALYLLNYPPNRPAIAGRTVSQPGADSETRPPRGTAAGFAPNR